MKRIIVFAVGLSVLAFVLAYAQPAPSFPRAPRPSPLPPESNSGHVVWVEPTNSLPKFDLDFAGGTPKDLVRAIERVTDKPLNVIIPDDCNDLKIPAFAVKNVTVAQLFETLKQVSKKTERYMLERPDNNWGFEERTSMYGFNTVGTPDENSIWYFYKEGEPGGYEIISATFCRFYQLSPYLDAGYKVDDITTAVETAWKMLGATNLPTMSYHKDTKVLIVTGEAFKVFLVGDVLKQLPTEKPKEKSGE